MVGLGCELIANSNQASLSVGGFVLVGDGGVGW